MSPDCADVAFEPGVPGTPKTRPGLTAINTFTSGSTLKYLATYTDLQTNNRNLFLDSTGVLWQEFPQGTFTVVDSSNTPNDFAKSDTAFGSEFMAFSDGKFGKDIPRRYTTSTEQSTFDRLSQVGPGLAPTAMDFTESGTIIGSTGGLVPFSADIDSLSQTSDVVTITLDPAAATFLYSQAGDQVTINGNADGYDGTFTIAQVISGASATVINTMLGLPDSSGGRVDSGVVAVLFTAPFLPMPSVGGLLTVAGADDSSYDGTFTIRATGSVLVTVYNPANSGTASGNGTASITGNISTGIHQISVCFITRNAYITAPAPPSSWTAAGSLPALVSNIPIGPANVIARLLIVTASGGDNFFFSQSTQANITTFLIPDNTTTSWIIDFTDLALNSSTSADLLFDRIELSEVAGILQFADRITAWGARNRIQNFVNMSFDGGVIVEQGYPLGWKVDPVSGFGGRTIPSSIFGFDYQIQLGSPGSGFSGLGGMITQGAYQDYLGVAILSPLKNITMRIRAKTAFNGFVTADIFVPSTNTVLATASSDGNLLNSSFQELIVAFDNPMPGTIPVDTVLRLYINVISETGAFSVTLKNAEIFPSDEPYQTSVLFTSNVADPEAFQGTTGFMEFNENDGRRITTATIIRDRFYVFKNGAGLFVTSDDPTNEPSGWTIDTISRRVGAESINSCGAHIGDGGEDWFFVISREGLYIFWSSEPPKVSQEIQPTWDLINKDALYTSWIVVDTVRRRILIGVPMGNATSPNKILVMDYQQVGATAESVASGAPVAPNYAGQIKAHTTARKWTIWNMQMSAGGEIEQDDGQAHLFLGDGSPTGKLYELDENALTDAGVPIPGGGYYVMASYPSDEQKNTLQMKGNRCLLRYMTMNVKGVGNLDIELFGPGFVNSQVIPILGAPALVLTNPAQQDLETYANFIAERIFIKITATHPTTPNWSLSNAQLYIGQDPVAPLRGSN